MNKTCISNFLAPDTFIPQKINILMNLLVWDKCMSTNMIFFSKNILLIKNIISLVICSFIFKFITGVVYFLCLHKMQPYSIWPWCIFTFSRRSRVWYQTQFKSLGMCAGKMLHTRIVKLSSANNNSTHVICIHDDVIKWKHFPRCWPFVRGVHRSPVNSPHKGQWHGALIFSLICTRTKKNGWVNNGEAGNLRRHCAHYDVTIMSPESWLRGRLSWISFIYLSVCQSVYPGQFNPTTFQRMVPSSYIKANIFAIHPLIRNVWHKCWS